MSQPARKSLPPYETPLLLLAALGTFCVGAGMACSRGGPSEGNTATERPPDVGQRSLQLTQVDLHAPGLRGLSGLTVDPQGRLWTVPESQRLLIELRVQGDRVEVAGESIVIEGMPSNLDAESLVALGHDQFLIGTEANHARTIDPVMRVSVTGQRASVKKDATMQFDYTPFSTTPRKNRGVEGACVTQQRVLLANENVIDTDRGRMAPLIVFDLTTGQVTRYLLRLSSDSGKLAAVACRTGRSGEVHAVAIERHYAVVRLLQFSLAGAGPSDLSMSAVQPSMIDLFDQLGGKVNPEGLAWLNDDTLWVISDNDTGGVRGPSRLFRTTVALP